MSDTHRFACRICSYQGESKKYTAREMMYGLRHEFLYYECGNCGCLQINEIPEDMSAYYPRDYYSFEKYDGKKFRGLNGKLKRLIYTNMIFGNPLVKYLMGFLTNQRDYEAFNELRITRNSRILDVGCGNGQSFLYPLAEIGFVNLLGCDPFLSNTISYRNGLTIQNTDIYSVSEKWDMITYHHSFEHISDPIENLAKVSELLNENGVCLVRIPTASSYAWKHYRTNWAQLDAPRHFFLHTKKSMQLIAENVEMELYKVVYDSTHFQFSGSEKYVNDTPLSSPRQKGLQHFLKRKMNKLSYSRRAKKLNKQQLGDQAGFYFRKKPNFN